MILFIRNRINQIEKERLETSQSHRKKYNDIQNKIENRKHKIKKSELQKHVEKELYRHF
ncbi:hypothetical protein ACJZA1_002623 [Staphylococcus pseudintermedius]|uniref:hypothetical protein n=1 Tax=Staphylococcus TaxID=1279 RepID=UPI001398BE1C|nr:MULTISPECIES: hypothetical protein [Staphylococcus]EGQ3166846.1 hypothetical protein [Staphylococcus pseudintermedius]EGQ3705617.1 hypothetical protein [Staphylococcus pseudintermedius]EHS7161009.1 hypothetical protein [Staphylococcus pseudintermedius]EHT6187034.1 hypothetical protein [Staphylococcus pseudintermedius]EII2712293.1 hypothetical protein [Staphylococcus pseudintermedius]